jgi:hypothetical protein
MWQRAKSGLVLVRGAQKGLDVRTAVVKDAGDGAGETGVSAAFDFGSASGKGDPS